MKMKSTVRFNSHLSLNQAVYVDKNEPKFDLLHNVTRVEHRGATRECNTMTCQN